MCKREEKALFANTRQDSPLYWFEKLAAIPRASGQEKQVSDYILAWARERGLEAYQGDGWNLIIKKPASTGMESCPPVILQAHMDMVCEKNADSTHDFDHDPISLAVDDGWLHSACGTTLGADDGIGVAMCMAALDDDSLVHPPLEVLLTVQEESTFYGAEHVDWQRLSGRRLINLDHAVQQQVLCGSCGGVGLTASFPLSQEAASGRLFQLAVTGLTGGHSGEDIHRGRGSANQLLVRALHALCALPQVRLVGLTGGTSRLAISREASAVLAAPGAEIMQAELTKLENVFRTEYAVAAPELRLTLEPLAEPPALQYTANAQQKALTVLSLFPDGIQQMNGAVPGAVESSINLGIIRADGPTLTLTAEIRGGYTSTVEAVQQKASLLTCAFGGEISFYSSYAPWQYRADSPLRQTAQRVYAGLFGSELQPTVVHAGIECGCFLAARPELDAIAIGPDCEYFHSPQERMNIVSAQEEWQFLRELLAQLT